MPSQGDEASPIPQLLQEEPPDKEESSSDKDGISG